MKYTKEQRLDIGRRIYDGEIDKYQAAKEYGISPSSARDYMRLYRDTNHLPDKVGTSRRNNIKAVSFSSVPCNQTSLQDYQNMTKEELIYELVQARIKEARLKKGYEVKGDGSIIRYSSKNTK